jgi:hypothetical protein
MFLVADPRAAAAALQLVAYNKVDVPDSGDYWEFVRDYLINVGVGSLHCPGRLMGSAARQRRRGFNV